MSHTWCRLHAASLNSAKIQRLSERLYKTWGNLLALTTPTDGWLPPTEEVAFALRIAEPEAQKRIDDLIAARCIDNIDGRLRMHDWDEHQFQSDSSTERSRKHRQRRKQQSGDVPRNDDATLQQQPGTVAATAPDTEQKQRQNRTDSEAAAARDAALPDPPDVRLIAAFDAAQEAVFAEQRRPWPAQTDLATARRMLEAGFAEADAKPFFEALLTRVRQSGKAAPKALAYAEGAVGEHLAALKRDPMELPTFLDRRQPAAVMDPDRLARIAEQAERNLEREKANG